MELVPTEGEGWGGAGCRQCGSQEFGPGHAECELSSRVCVGTPCRLLVGHMILEFERIRLETINPWDVNI